MQRPTNKPAPAARLRLRITPAAEASVRSGHPWVYGESIRDQNRAGEAGELGVVYDRKDRFLAVGLFDPNSPIRLRVLHSGKPETVNRAWWSRRLQSALAKRNGLFDADTTGYRWINGESDGWPGLVLDRYDSTLVLKLYTASWLPRISEVLDLIVEHLAPDRLVLRLSRNIQDAAKQFNASDGQVLLGPPVPEPVVFLENGLRFEAEVARGQKTGFFLDQRENRQTVGSLAEGRRVLNTFSFSGGFSLYAARGGATSVTDVDISPHALESSRRNFALNKGIEKVASCRRGLVQADAFEWLGESQRTGARFDLVVLDPPSLARRETERRGALNAYLRLASSALGLLAPRGILVACSCSAHVSAEEFFGAMRKLARASRPPMRELRTAGHAPDHPATLKEAQYLKAIYLQAPGSLR
jgi:23S rRNA (cytosine1962-C5)-methyltransferase